MVESAIIFIELCVAALPSPNSSNITPSETELFKQIHFSH
jgi:hypothetical protein